MTAPTQPVATHEQGALIEHVARALCRFVYPTRDEMERISTSCFLWQRLIHEAEVAIQAMREFQSPQSEIAPTNAAPQGAPAAPRDGEIEGKPAVAASIGQVSAIRRQAFLDAAALCVSGRDAATMLRMAHQDEDSRDEKLDSLSARLRGHIFAAHNPGDAGQLMLDGAVRIEQLERALAEMHAKFMGALGASEAKNDEIAQLRHDLNTSRSATSLFTREDAAKIVERKAKALTEEYCHGDSGPGGYVWSNKEAEWQVILLEELAEEFRDVKRV